MKKKKRKKKNNVGTCFYSHSEILILLQTVADNHVHYSTVFLKEYSTQLVSKIMPYISMLEISQLRDFNKSKFYKIKVELKRILLRCYDDKKNKKMKKNGGGVGILLESLTLKVALHFLQLNMLNRRLDGLRMLNDCKQMIIARQYNQTHGEQATWLNATIFIRWLIEKDVLNILFRQGRLHVQVLKETIQLLGFLAKEEMLSTNEIDILWQLTSSDDSEMKKTAYGVFQALSLQLRSFHACMHCLW